MAADEFERAYLETDEVVHREKVTFRGAAVVVGSLAIASSAFSVAGFVAAAYGEPGAIAGGLFFALVAGTLGLASVVGTVLRTIVTKSEVVLHAGIRHEARIPLASITSVSLTRYDARARARIIEEAREAFAAVVPGKDLVQIEWRGADGREHIAIAASDAPAQLAEIVQRAAAAARGPSVRVEAGAAGAIGEDAEEAADDARPRARRDERATRG